MTDFSARPPIDWVTTILFSTTFVAAVIGGFGSLAGAVIGAYVLGFAEIFLIGFLPPELSSYRDAFVFLLLIFVLLVRPNGILGSTEREKV